MTDDQISSGETSIILLTGKGGVGKTTCSAATALHNSSSGKRTLAISTDATPSLSHIFEIHGNHKPVMVKESLYVNELGVEEVKEMWDLKFGKEVHEVFSAIVNIEYEDFVQFMTSLLPGLSDEFTVDYIRELSKRKEYDTIVWDTAPLGQTLALLNTPAMLREHLRMAPRIYSKLKFGQRSKEPILDILKRWEKLSADNMEFLRNQVKFIMVTIPEALAFKQLEGVFQEMNEHGLKVQKLIINNVCKAQGSEFLVTKTKMQKQYLDAIHKQFSSLDIIEVPMFPYELTGLGRIKEVERVLFH